MIDQDLTEAIIKATEEVAVEEIVAEVAATVVVIEAEEKVEEEEASQISHLHQPFFQDSQCLWLSITSDSNLRETNQKSTSILSISFKPILLW